MWFDAREVWEIRGADLTLSPVRPLSGDFWSCCPTAPPAARAVLPLQAGARCLHCPDCRARIALWRAAPQVHKAAVGRVSEERGIGLRFPRFLRIRCAWWPSLARWVSPLLPKRWCKPRCLHICCKSGVPASCGSRALQPAGAPGSAPLPAPARLLQGGQGAGGCDHGGAGGGNVSCTGEVLWRLLGWCPRLAQAQVAEPPATHACASAGADP